MPGAFTNPDLLWKPGATDTGWDALVSANFQNIQDLINAIVGSTRPINPLDPLPMYERSSEAQARVDALAPEFVVTGKASSFFTASPAMVQTDARAFKTGSNSWADALDAALGSISSGGVYCAPELGEVQIDRTISVGARKFLYSPVVMGLNAAPLTAGGPGFRLKPSASMAQAVLLAGQGAGICGIGILDDTNALTGSALKGNVDEVWGFGFAIAASATTLPIGVDFGSTSRSGLSHFIIGGGVKGLTTWVDGNFGPGRIKTCTGTLVEVGAGCVFVGPYHFTGPGVTIRFLASDSAIMGMYLDATATYFLEFASSSGCARNKVVGGRMYHNMGDGVADYPVHFDSTNSDCESNIIDDFTIDKLGSEPNWTALALFDSPANQNRDHRLGIIDASTCADLCADADRKRFTHVGAVRLTNGKIMRGAGPVALTDAATVAVSCIDGTGYYTLSSAVNRAIGNPTSSALGRELEFSLRNTSGGSITFTFGANYNIEGAGQTFAVAATSRRTIRFRCSAIGADVWDEIGRTADL